MHSVLVIDDSSTQRAWLRAVLERRDLRVVDCASSDWAFIAASAVQMNLVMVALRLEAGNGFELGLCVRDAGCANVVVHSDCLATTDGDWACSIGLQGAVTVPAPVSLLRQCIHDLIECQRQEIDHGHGDTIKAA